MSRKSILVLFIALFALLSLPLSAAAQGPDNRGQEALIRVTGLGNAFVEANYVTINANIEAFEPTSTEAFESLAADLADLTVALSELGVAEEDIRTSGLTVYREQIFNDMGPTDPPTYNYRATRTIIISLNDPSLEEDALNAIFDNGGVNLNGVYYSAVNYEEASVEARRLAVEDARTQAEALAAELGVEVGEVVAITQYGTGAPYYVTEYGGSLSGRLPADANPNSLVVQVSVEVTFALVR